MVPWKIIMKNITRKPVKYSMVEQTPLATYLDPTRMHACWRKLMICFLLLSLCVTSAFIGFTVGRHYPIGSKILNIQSLTKTFHYNASYAAAPSPESDLAWAENLPNGEGFMVAHSLISNVSAFSVFHQLHCINILRHGYYSALSATSNAGQAIPSMLHHGSTVHVAHCFDYLRQCVECSSDTNIEPVDWSKGGVTGWGFERLCKNYTAVKEYAEGWRTY